MLKIGCVEQENANKVAILELGYAGRNGNFSYAQFWLPMLK